MKYRYLTSVPVRAASPSVLARTSLRWSLLVLACLLLPVVPARAQTLAPVITSFDPASLPVGGDPTSGRYGLGGGFILSVIGTDFCDEAVVLLRTDGADPEPVDPLLFDSLFESATEMRVVLHAQLLSAPRIFQVVVNHPAQSACAVKGDSNSLPFTIEKREGNLVVNGSFEDPAIADGALSVSDYPVGWSSDEGFSIWRGHLGFMAHDGSQHIELDSGQFGTTTIFQNLATVPGTTYRLSFAVANRPDLDGGGPGSGLSRIEAYWNDKLVLTAERAEGTWEVFETFATATEPSEGNPPVTRLEFRAAGPADGLGDFLDDVRVVEVKPHLITGVCDAAGCQKLISPGSIVSVFGLFTPSTETASTIPLAQSLGGLSVTFNDIPGALFGVFDGDSDQANVQAPWDLDVSSGKVQVKVHVQDEGGEVTSDPFVADAALASPGIYMYPPGTAQAIVTNYSQSEDDGVIAGSWAQVLDSIPGVVTQPAAIDGVVTIWANGLGAVIPVPATGDIPPAGTVPVTDKTVRVFVGGVEAQVLGAVLQPTSVGLNQINIIIPAGVTPGDAVPIVIEVECPDGTKLRSREDATIAVRATS
jgi:uncharacterized protein (TIGR03437 family)